MIASYRLCARAEGKSPKTIEMVASCVGYLDDFLNSEGLATNVSAIGPTEIRAYMLYLQHKKRFSDHRYTHIQPQGLSQHTVNSYLRSIRAFWGWLFTEEIVRRSPFSRTRIPKAPRKIVPTFTETQIRALLSVIDTSTLEGFRDHVVILTLLDTGLRIGELTSLRLSDLRLDEGVVKVMGKGEKERLIPIGRTVKRLLWRYVNLYRPEPANPSWEYVFINTYGLPLKRQRMGERIARYGRKANITGVRCSPHTFRHTAAVTFIRNGGDVFSLQRLLGHSTLVMTRHYCEVADVDVIKAHMRASPVDNLVTSSGDGLVLSVRKPKRR